MFTSGPSVIPVDDSLSSSARPPAADQHHSRKVSPLLFEA